MTITTAAAVNPEVPDDTQSTSDTPTEVPQPEVPSRIWLAAAEGNVAAINRARALWVDALKSEARDGRQALHAMAQAMPNGDTRYDVLGVACDLSGLGQWVPNDGQVFYLIDRFFALRGAVGRARGYVETPTRMELAHGRLPDAVRLALGLRTSTGEFRLTSEWLAECRTTRPALVSALAIIIPTSYDDDAWAPVVGLSEVDGITSDTPTEVYIGTSLAVLNDMGLSLPYLAEVIESQPPGLFAWGTRVA